MFKVFIGLPGSGKTCMAVRIARRYLKRGVPVFSNVPIPGTFRYSPEQLGSCLIEDACLILDEAGIDLNNRAFKSMSKNQISFWKYYRHYGLDVFVFSQAFDFDVTLRRLADRIYILRRSLLPGFSFTQRFGSSWVTGSDGQPMLSYKLLPFSRFYFFRPFQYKYFNTLIAPSIPSFDFERW